MAGKSSAWVAVRHDDHYLIARRAQGVKNPGLWNFFGGTVDGRETHSLAAVRELREEAGIPIQEEALTLQGVYQNNDDVYSFFILDVDSRVSPVLNGEHDKFQWVSVGEFTRMGLLHKPTAFWVDVTLRKSLTSG